MPKTKSVPKNHLKSAMRIADYLLKIQNKDGVIPDEPDGTIANEDSNMEYALMGIAAAYWQSKNRKYLNSLENGIHWLAARQEMQDSRWKGSFRYAFTIEAPYHPVQCSPGAGIEDVRGVDTTSALFVYLLYLHSKLTSDRMLADKYEPNARAALDFIIENNLNSDGVFASSWQMKLVKIGRKEGAENTKNKSTDKKIWKLLPYQYTADQADCYLGLRAGYLLYNDTRYQKIANTLKRKVPVLFFDRIHKKYAVGRGEDGSLDHDPNNFSGIFCQGYLSWVFGKNQQNMLCHEWLTSCRQDDGALSCFPNDRDPKYSLSVAIYALSAQGLHESIPEKSINWLLSNTFDKNDGAVRDTLSFGSAKFSNVAGFTIMSLVRFPAFP